MNVITGEFGDDLRDGMCAGDGGRLPTTSFPSEQALRAARDGFEAVFHASPLPIVAIDPDGKVSLWSSAAERLFGWTAADVVGKPLMIVPPSKGDEHESIRRRIAAGDMVENMVTVRMARDGRMVPVTLSTSVVRNPEGELTGIVAVYGDLTEQAALRDERRQAELAQMESDARFRQIADTIQEVFWLTDLEKGRIVYVSPGYEQIWGRTCESLYENPRDWLAAIHPDDRQRVLDAALTKQSAGSYDEEYRIVRPDGAVRWIRDRGFPVRDARGCVIRVAGSAQDVTEKRELEAQLVQTQKMESIGQLAGGVAHDFNNLLTVIATNCYVLGGLLPEAEETAALVEEIRIAGERAAALTRQLLAFSRREVIEPKVVDLGNVIIETEKMLRRLLGEDVTLALSLSSERTYVKVDPGSWVQVLMNLAVNARDAMPRGGTLTIETRIRQLGDDVGRSRLGVPAGSYVLLSISDTGTGMPPDVLARVFEPFFTTKEVGKGTGIGLSVVHGIVKQSGGHIDVSSQPGAGTTFGIYLPLAAAARVGAPEPAESKIASGSENILVVEDDEQVRRVTRRALERLGYCVLEASNGNDALEVLRGYDGVIDLLVTDVVMPSMGGRELAERLAASHPDARVIYTSGYPDDALMRAGIKDLRVAFLRKPYDSPSLLHKIGEVLRSSRGAQARRSA
jgi:two-component system cell cycle sensor histidine kinase/response regulator CckA